MGSVVMMHVCCRRIYWTDWGDKAKIESAALDGTDRTVVIDSSLVWPNGLAIDRLERRLYWADAELDKIEMVFANGSDRRVLVCEDLPHVFGFTLLGKHCFCCFLTLISVCCCTFKSVKVEFILFCPVFVLCDRH